MGFRAYSRTGPGCGTFFVSEPIPLFLKRFRANKPSADRPGVDPRNPSQGRVPGKRTRTLVEESGLNIGDGSRRQGHFGEFRPAPPKRRSATQEIAHAPCIPPCRGRARLIGRRPSDRLARREPTHTIRDCSGRTTPWFRRIASLLPRQRLRPGPYPPWQPRPLRGSG